MLVHLQTWWSAAYAAAGQVARAYVTQGSDGQADLMLFDAGSNSLMTVDLNGGIGPSNILSQSVLSGNQVSIWVPVDGVNMRFDTFALQSSFDLGEAVSLYLNRNAFTGASATVLRFEMEGGQYFMMARPTGDGVVVYRINSARDVVEVSDLNDRPGLYLNGVSDLSFATVGASQFVIAVSQMESGISVLRLGPGGVLTPVSSLGVDQRLPVSHPTATEVVTYAGQTFVLVASAGTSSVSVLSLDAEGELRLVDHLIDTRDTRFGGATAMDVVTVGAEVLVAVAGADGGITLLQMLPGGRLMVRAVIEDQMHLALDGVRQLEFVEAGGRLNLIVVSNEGGVSRFEVQTGPAGIQATGLEGTAGSDVLTAPRGGGVMVAGAGADVLIAGAGADTLRGGSGADVFVLSPGGPNDVIADFERGIDQIDLSRFTTIRGLAPILIEPRPDGAILTIGTTIIIVRSHDGRTLDVATIQDALILNLGQGGLPSSGPISEGAAPEPIGGGGDTLPAVDRDDVFIWSPAQRVYDGAGGTDRVEFGAAQGSVVVDLRAPAANAGVTAGHQFISIENMTGGAFDDTLRGDDGINVLRGEGGADRLFGEGGDDVLYGDAGTDYLYGGAGADTLYGGAGSDWIVPGRGNDVIFGGADNDTIVYGDATAGMVIDICAGRATGSGGEVDTFSGIEHAMGTTLDDTLIGDSGANRLRSLGGRDTFIATAGADTYEGGGSADIVRYDHATGPINVNLTTGRGSGGLAEGHRYIEIERIRGTDFNDTLTGSAGRDFLSGGGGDDFIFATASNDYYYGGLGSDTVDYRASSAGIEVFLNLNRGSGGLADSHGYVSIENVIGSGSSDRIQGNLSDNRLEGGAGNDTLRGYAGDDVLIGGSGNDLFFGDEGNDLIFGGGGNDRVFGGAGFDRAYLTGNRSEYRIERLSGGEVRVTHQAGSRADGVDSYFAVEQLVFADGAMML